MRDGRRGGGGGGGYARPTATVLPLRTCAVRKQRSPPLPPSRHAVAADDRSRPDRTAAAAAELENGRARPDAALSGYLRDWYTTQQPTVARRRRGGRAGNGRRNDDDDDDGKTVIVIILLTVVTMRVLTTATIPSRLFDGRVRRRFRARERYRDGGGGGGGQVKSESPRWKIRKILPFSYR